MRVAHLISPAGLYGKEQWLLAFLKYVDRSRFEPVVVPVSVPADASFEARVLGCGVEIVRLGVRRNFSPAWVTGAASLVRERRIDCVHAHDYRADFIAFAARTLTGVTVVSTPHGWSNEADLKLRAYQAADKLLLRFFDHVAPLSRRLEEGLGAVKRDRMTLIPNFVDLSDLPVPNDRDPKLFSFVGRLVALKRVEDAVRALRLTEDGGITLQIVGDGPLRRGLERLVETTGLSRRVSFLGFRDDALPLLARSAALVLPSLTEGISRVSMEAMALGRPVIATDIPGNRELIENGVTGFLVPVRNPGAIARCMDTLAADRAIYDAISRSAAEYIVRHRSAAVIVGEYERLYERVMTRGA